jgi:hypothetical protein
MSKIHVIPSVEPLGMGTKLLASHWTSSSEKPFALMLSVKS